MKNLVVTVVIAIAVMASFSQAKAQYAIPSYDVQIISPNTTFEDSPFVSDNDGTREERKIFARVEDEPDRSHKKAYAFIVMYKLDGTLQVGPFKVKEGKDFSFPAGDDTWGINVINASSNCVMSAWTE